VLHSDNGAPLKRGFASLEAARAWIAHSGMGYVTRAPPVMTSPSWPRAASSTNVLACGTRSAGPVMRGSGSARSLSLSTGGPAND